MKRKGAKTQSREGRKERGPEQNGEAVHALANAPRLPYTVRGSFVPEALYSGECMNVADVISNWGGHGNGRWRRLGETSGTEPTMNALRNAAL